MKTSTHKGPFTRAAAILVASATWVSAQTLPAVAFSSTNLGYGSGGTAVVGWSFTVSTPILVIDLSLYDLGSDGLAGTGQVGLWKNDGTLLAQATIPNGTVAPIDNGFRYVALTSPVTLLPGTTYVVGGRAGSTDPQVYQERNPVFAAPITYVAERLGRDNSFNFPSISADTTNGSPAGFGGSFLFTAPVPEPSTWAMLAAGAGARLAFRRRSRKRN